MDYVHYTCHCSLCKKTLRGHPSSPSFLVGSVLLIFFSFLCCPIVCLDVLSSVLWCPLRFLHTNDVQVRSLYLQMFVGGFMSYLRYLCLFAHSGIQHILCSFLFFRLRLVYPMLPVSLGYPFFFCPISIF